MSLVALPWEVFTGAALCLLWMAVLFVVHLRTGNAGVVDFGWTVCVGGLALLYAASGTGIGARRILLVVMAGVWAARLATHLARRGVFGAHEDGRYKRLRAYWGERANTWLFVVFLGQALLAVLLSLPFWFASDATTPLRATDIGAALLWIGALGGEALADRQLARFLSQPENRGRTCRDGLWGWSRHPNYFFEWLVWCAFALLATTAPMGWLAWSAPAMMLFFILKVTGIPPTELQAVHSRGDEYRAYQRTTSAFVPLPPRREVTP